MKKLLAVLGFGSVATFVGLFFQVAHFGRNQLLFGNFRDVEMAASRNVFGVVELVHSVLNALMVLLRANGFITLLVLVILAGAAIFVARAHRADASMLAGITVVAFVAFWFFGAPWLLVSNVFRDHALHPQQFITGSDRVSAAARENWSCLVCASVTDTRFKSLACAGTGHDPVACAAHIQGRFALAAGAALLLVGALAYVILARGNWIDRASPGSGFTKATLAALSFVCILVVSLNVYAAGYIYGKTAQGFELEKVRQVEADFTSDAVFLIARTSSAATLLLGHDDPQQVEIAGNLRLESAGRANVLAEVLTTIAEAEWKAQQSNTFFKRDQQ